MVKLTAELIEQAAQYTNAVRDRELDLRGELGGAQSRLGPGVRLREAGPAACAEAGGWPAGLPPGLGVPACGGRSRRTRRNCLLARAPASGHGASVPSPARTR